jgi:hypothetical protein
MENFIGMHRDSARVKIPAGSWEHAQNILLQKGKGSISNEYGFDLQAPIPGDYLGCIATNEETVVFSIDNGFSCIGIIKTDNPFIYIPKIRSIYLGFKKNRPIEGVFLYNYNKELIIIWSDGVFVDSTVPRLLNLTDININLDINLELVNPSDLSLISLFNATQEADISINYGGVLSLPLNVVYITYTYILADGISTTGYYPVQNLAYPIHDWKEEVQRSILIHLEGLDTNYSQLQLGLLVNYEGALLGYQSPIFSYTGTSFDLEITALGSYTEITIDELVVPTIYYNRVKSMTIQNNTLVFGNVATDNLMNLQKYINNLEVGLKLIIEEEDAENLWTHPTLCPDEVYAIYVQPQLKSSEYLEAFPLIGPDNRYLEELDLLTAPELELLGLRNTAGDGLDANIWKRFHIENRGEFVLPAPYVIGDPLHSELHWGYWENEEVYPNNDQFNGTVDYNGNPIIGGKDVRGLPIKYFRVPGLDKISEKVPCLAGVVHKNDDRRFNVSGGITRFLGSVPRFGIYLKNIEEAIPEEIRNQLQALRILIVKRKTGDRIVEDIPFAKQAAISEQDTDGSVREYLGTVASNPINDWTGYRLAQYGLSKLTSNILTINKPAITAKVIKANYGIRYNIGETNDLFSEELPIQATGFSDFRFIDGTDMATAAESRFGVDRDFWKVPNTQKYAFIEEIEYLPGNNIAAKTFLIEESIILRANNYLEVATGGISDVPDFRWNPFVVTHPNSSCIGSQYNNTTYVYEDSPIGEGIAGDSVYELFLSTTLLNLYKNIYTGFKPTEFISLGRIPLTNVDKTLYTYGDIFTNNVNNTTIGMPIGTNILGRIQYNQLLIKGMWGVNSNSLIYVVKDRNFNWTYEIDSDGSQTTFLAGLVYTPTIFNKEWYRSLNDYISATSYSVNNKTISYFPFRVARTPKIANENLQTDVLRTFRANDYYEMPNNRGEVIAVRGTNKQLFIQQKHSLFVATLKDKLNTGQSETYLGEGDIFDRSPDEIKYNTDKGYIGCTNQIAAIVCPEGYVVVDQIKGNIFIIGSNFAEISKAGMTNWFENNWNIEDYYTLDRFGNKQPVDNPYNSVGHLIGYDEKFNRLLFTKKYYKFLFPNEVGTTYTFDGEFYYLVEDDISTQLDFTDTFYFVEESKTISYDIAESKWICEHKYYPNAYYFNTFGLWSFSKDTVAIEGGIEKIFRLYRHNSLIQKRGTYYNNITYQSYVDLVFNSRLDLSKQYQAVEWESVVQGINGVRKYNKTIDKVMIYSDYQCSGEVEVNQYSTARNTEGLWQFNEFRNIVVSQDFPIVREDGSINVNNLNINRSYFEKSFFIGTFVIVRLIMLNNSEDDVYINFVNVKSRVSKR